MKNIRLGILFTLIILIAFTLSGCKGNNGIEEETNTQEEQQLEEEENIILVSNAEELLASIGPDRTIIVLDGDYDLLSVEVDNEYIRYEDSFDGRELIIYKADNLKIIGDEISKPHFFIEPRYSNVMVFNEVTNFSMENIVLGHKEDLGDCSGGVLKFISSENVSLNNLDLYGCGTLGINIIDSEKFRIIDANIYENTYGALEFENSNDIEFIGGKIHNNTVFEALIKAKNSKKIVFNETIFDNNSSYYGEDYVSYDYFVMNESDTPINFNNCQITNNSLLNFYFIKDQYTDTLVMGNKFEVETDENGLYNNTYTANEDSWYKEKIDESTAWLEGANLSDKKAIKEEAIARYEALINELGVLDLRGIETSLRVFREMSRDIKNEEINDELFAIYLDYYKKYIDLASYSMFSYSELEKIYGENTRYGFISIDEISDKKLKLKVESAILSGFRLEDFYGNIYISEVRGFILSKVQSHISDGMIKFLELREEEKSGKFSDYDEAVISLDYNFNEVDRLVKWEKFYRDYPEFLERENFTNYLEIYENSLKRPFANISREIIDESMYNQNDFYMMEAYQLLSYKRLFDLYPYSAYTQKYKSIIDTIEKNNNIITSDVKDALIENEIIATEGNYDKYFENAMLYYNTINKFKTDLSKYKEEVKNPPISNVKSDIRKVRVDNIYQMFKEIASNKHIIMKSGVYKISLDYLEFTEMTENVNKENTIRNVENLIIESDSAEPIVLILDYGVVLRIEDSENVLLNNFILGHSTEICNGNVIEIVNSKNVNVNNSLLFGSGYIGFYVDRSNDIKLNRSLITDTTTNAISIIDSENVGVNTSRVYENFVPYVIDIDNSRAVTIEKSQIINNGYEKNISKLGKEIIKMDKVEDLVIRNSYFIENNFRNIYSEEFDSKVKFIDNISN